MRILTAEEKKHYDELGYVVVSDFFSVNELSEINKELDGCEAPVQSTGEHEGFTYQLAMLTDKTKAFAYDERILTLIEDIVKPGISIFSSKLLTKLPHSPSVCHWHQDDAYYTEVVNSDTRMSIWVPLQDTDEKNGCLWIVPGSHKQGLLPYTVKNNGTCRKALVEEQVDLSKAEPVPMKAGSILLFNALTWHSSKGNETDQIRRAFIVSYQEATVPVGRGKQHIILRPAI
ncbi:phytanoyl-CoA dioxygenase family protein [Paenibacillus doosanensis]|uniref:phytanoyl-CoA dioxygenase family protein n=1 Tax=Paenibacillus doosanensis TaxID=1229154 RepID=UPI00218023DA|nr:phytanoyl-CoA dioxygenase family protein [Paenibacillus doosanensis]MCS7464289.1 phytanoyl-CoA dioxygenase family protein [Paenibacillus doosanensis]